MSASENALLARGVKLYFICRQDIPDEDHATWQEAVSLASPLRTWFGGIEFEYSDHPDLISDWQGWNLVKIFCPHARVSVKPSEARLFYENVFVRLSEWFSKLCEDRGIDCKPYDFRILFRLHPPEDPQQFVPIPSLDGISAKLVSPQATLTRPPLTLVDMLERVQEVVSRRKLDELLAYAEREGLTLYADYGIRSEHNSDVCQFYILVPGASGEIQTMQSLQGDLYHELILHSTDAALADFEGIANALLTRLVQNGAIDNQKAEQARGNLHDHLLTGQGHTRFAIRFDIKESGMNSELMRAVDLTKKAVQKELQATPYHLYGAVSYALTDADLGRIEEILEEVPHFRTASRDSLCLSLCISMVVSDYNRALEAARRTDEIIQRHMLPELPESAFAPTDIEDAKRRWDSAASEQTQQGRTVRSYIFIRSVSAIPIQAFLDTREPVYEEFSRLAERLDIGATITSDSFVYSSWGCYVAAS